MIQGHAPTVEQVRAHCWWWSIPASGNPPHVLMLDVDRDGGIVEDGAPFVAEDWPGQWAPCLPPTSQEWMGDDLRRTLLTELRMSDRAPDSEIVEAVAFLRREVGRLRQPDLDPRRSCYSKKRYDTEQQAAKIVGRSKRPLHVYKCQFCGGHHLTGRAPTPAAAERGRSTVER